MKFKLDENLGPFFQQFLSGRGHDCHLLVDEGLAGAQDGEVMAAAKNEGRVLVTLDRDFGDVLRYPPEPTPGIVVLSPHGRMSRESLLRLLSGVLDALQTRTIGGRLWIVEPGRIREHAQSDAD